MSDIWISFEGKAGLLLYKPRVSAYAIYEVFYLDGYDWVQNKEKMEGVEIDCDFWEI